MAYVLSSISGNLISAASAGFAPTNGADVSAIASAYVSGKQDELTFGYDADNAISSINNSALAGGGTNVTSGQAGGFDYISADNAGAVIGHIQNVGGATSVLSTGTASFQSDSYGATNITSTSDITHIRVVFNNWYSTFKVGFVPYWGAPTADVLMTDITANGEYLIPVSGLNSIVYSYVSGNASFWDVPVSAMEVETGTGMSGILVPDESSISSIASSYAKSAQVVSSTATQLYAGTAYVTSLNSAPLSASRAGNAANAAIANSAYYDGTGRLISALPDSATVSAIASSYAASAASSKQDSSAMSAYALSADVSGCIDTVSANSATWGTQVVSSLYSAPAYGENWVTSINDMKLSAERANSAQWGRSAIFDNKGRYLSSLAASADVSGCIDTVSAQSATWGGSALALSAGAGISLTLVDNVLVISTAGD